MDAKRVYFAAPLFSLQERDYNTACARVLEHAGYTVFLPQRDAGELGTNEDREGIYAADILGLTAADVVVAVLDHRALDEGTVYEIGYAQALGKPVVAICSCDRYLTRNVMFDKVVRVHGIHQAVLTIKGL
jgi:nucleoside 2-deoxyribosyltransferase